MCEVATATLIKQGFRLSWYDRAADIPDPAPEGNGSGDGEGDGEGEDPTTPSGKRIKFTCPKCNVNAWGKGSLNLKTIFDTIPKINPRSPEVWRQTGQEREFRVSVGVS